MPAVLIHPAPPDPQTCGHRPNLTSRVSRKPAGEDPAGLVYWLIERA